jgi:hypothetical protein
MQQKAFRVVDADACGAIAQIAPNHTPLQDANNPSRSG